VGWSDFYGGVARLADPFDPVASRGYLVQLSRWQPADLDTAWLRGPGSQPTCRVDDIFTADVPDWFIEDTLRTLWRRGDVDWQIVTRHIDRAQALLARLPGPRHIWLGVAVADQAAAWQVPVLAATTTFPTRFVAADPLKEPIWLGLVAANAEQRNIAWVVAGGVVGAFERQWAVDLLHETHQAGAAFHYCGCVSGSRWNHDFEARLAGKQWKELPR
jgi:protein gp37